MSTGLLYVAKFVLKFALKFVPELIFHLVFPPNHSFVCIVTLVLHGLCPTVCMSGSDAKLDIGSSEEMQMNHIRRNIWS